MMGDARSMEEISMGFEFFMAINTEITIFWDVKPCSQVDMYQCFRGILVPT
jgi:hypothetical protein